MSTPYTIPLQPAPQSLTLTLGGNDYNCNVKWNAAANCWVLDIFDTSNNPVVMGIAIVTGVDLLRQFGYLNFGGKLYVQTDFSPFAVPTEINLGTNGNLFFVVDNS